MALKRKPDAVDASHEQEPEITVWVRRDMRDWRKALHRLKDISAICSNERVWSKPAVSDGQKPIAFPTRRRPFPLVRVADEADRSFPTIWLWKLLPAAQ